MLAPAALTAKAGGDLAGALRRLRGDFGAGFDVGFAAAVLTAGLAAAAFTALLPAAGFAGCGFFTDLEDAAAEPLPGLDFDGLAVFGRA